MNRMMMKSKVHRATITGANLDYVGSITLDRVLMDLADIREKQARFLTDIGAPGILDLRRVRTVQQ